MHFYQPQRSCGQGNILAPVCHSVDKGGGMLCIPVYIAGGIPACLAAGLRWGGCAIPACIAGGIPACLAAGLGGGVQHTVNERPVRILLEYILVVFIFLFFGFRFCLRVRLPCRQRYNIVSMVTVALTSRIGLTLHVNIPSDTIQAKVIKLYVYFHHCRIFQCTQTKVAFQW